MWQNYSMGPESNTEFFFLNTFTWRSYCQPHASRNPKCEKYWDIVLKIRLFLKYLLYGLSLTEIHIFKPFSATMGMKNFLLRAKKGKKKVQIIIKRNQLMQFKKDLRWSGVEPKPVPFIHKKNPSREKREIQHHQLFQIWPGGRIPGSCTDTEGVMPLLVQDVGESFSERYCCSCSMEIQADS